MATEMEREEAERQNLMNVSRVVRRSEHPHPMTLVLIILVVMFVMYILFVNFVKKSLTGVWSDADDETHTIVHDKWRNTIVVDRQYKGAVHGHLVAINKKGELHTGLWMNNQIKWTDGSSWYCAYGV